MCHARIRSEDDETLDRHKNSYRRFRESLYEGRVMNRLEITKPAVIIYQGDAAVNIWWSCLNPKKFIRKDRKYVDRLKNVGVVRAASS